MSQASTQVGPHRDVITRDMIPVFSGVHGGDLIACDVVSPGMGGRCVGI